MMVDLKKEEEGIIFSRNEDSVTLLLLLLLELINAVVDVRIELARALVNL